MNPNSIISAIFTHKKPLPMIQLGLHTPQNMSQKGCEMTKSTAIHMAAAVMAEILLGQCIPYQANRYVSIPTGGAAGSNE